MDSTVPEQKIKNGASVLRLLHFGGEGGIRIIEDGKIVINPVSLNH
ncbi:hypothetical protein [Dysosmobacter sp.]|nr:hypothetical protein [Dysosmobacter sp.]